jgi:hypothetical protein
MKCYRHRENQSIGICKSCGKAICQECVVEFPKGLACSVECEKDAKELITMNDRAKKIYGIGDYQSSRLPTGVLVWLLLSGLMWIVAGARYFILADLDYSSAAMATVFSIITIIVYRGSKRTGLNC